MESSNNKKDVDKETKKFKHPSLYSKNPPLFLKIACWLIREVDDVRGYPYPVDGIFLKSWRRRKKSDRVSFILSSAQKLKGIEVTYCPFAFSAFWPLASDDIFSLAICSLWWFQWYWSWYNQEYLSTICRMTLLSFSIVCLLYAEYVCDGNICIASLIFYVYICWLAHIYK